MKKNIQSLIIGAFMLGYAGNAYSVDCTTIDLSSNQSSSNQSETNHAASASSGKLNLLSNQSNYDPKEEMCKIGVDFSKIIFNDCYRFENDGTKIALKDLKVEGSYDDFKEVKSDTASDNKPSIEDILGIDVDYLLRVQESSHDVTGKLAHAEKIYKKYGDFIKKLTDEYDIPLVYFMGKIGVEGGDTSGKNFRSKTGAKGINQLHNGAVDIVLRQILESGNEDNLLYKDALAYSSMKESKKEAFLDSIRNHPRKNIAVGAGYTRYLINIYGDLTFSAAAYQIGPGKVASLLEKYRKYGKYGGHQLCEIRGSNGKSYTHIYDSRVRDFISEHKINFTDMMSNPGVKKYFRAVGGRYDTPIQYSEQVIQTALVFAQNNMDNIF